MLIAGGWSNDPPFQPKPSRDSVNTQKTPSVPARPGAPSPPVLACGGCCLQLCPQPQERQQEDASRSHAAGASGAGTEPAAI